LGGKIQQVNESYKNGVGLIVELFNLNSLKASSLYDSALSQHSSGSDDISILGNCIYSYYSERESLLGCLEILLKFADPSNSDDPIPTISRCVQEIFDQKADNSCISSLFKLIVKNSLIVEKLTPLPNDSTTQVLVYIY
jgi:hypothetical protein